MLDQAAIHLAQRLPGVLHVTTQFKLEREMFCQDGFHPSQLGYARWGEQLAEMIVKSGKVSVYSLHYAFEQSS